MRILRFFWMYIQLIGCFEGYALKRRTPQMRRDRIPVVAGGL
jgi:hypothetical protein